MAEKDDCLPDTPVRTFRDLDVWQQSMDLVVAAYDLSKRLPLEERFGLQTQIRSAAVSIPANVAEGQSCGKDGRFLAHVGIAQGSLGELETRFEIARRLSFVGAAELQKLERHLRRTGQLLNGLKRSLKKRRLARLRHNASVVLLGLLLACGLLAALGQVRRTTDYGRRTTDYGLRTYTE